MTQVPCPAFNVGDRITRIGEDHQDVVNGRTYLVRQSTRDCVWIAGSTHGYAAEKFVKSVEPVKHFLWADKTGCRIASTNSYDEAVKTAQDRMKTDSGNGPYTIYAAVAEVFREEPKPPVIVVKKL